LPLETGWSTRNRAATRRQQVLFIKIKNKIKDFPCNFIPDPDLNKKNCG
jgi:hypothetical protein